MKSRLRRYKLSFSLLITYYIKMREWESCERVLARGVYTVSPSLPLKHDISKSKWLKI